MSSGFIPNFLLIFAEPLDGIFDRICGFLKDKLIDQWLYEDVYFVDDEVMNLFVVFFGHEQEEDYRNGRMDDYI